MSCNARAEMAIADFFHSDGVAFSLVESPRFHQMCQALRYVGNDFKVPSRFKLGGELLDINFETCHKANVEVPRPSYLQSTGACNSCFLLTME